MVHFLGVEIIGRIHYDYTYSGLSHVRTNVQTWARTGSRAASVTTIVVADGACPQGINPSVRADGWVYTDGWILADGWIRANVWILADGWIRANVWIPVDESLGPPLTIWIYRCRWGVFRLHPQSQPDMWLGPPCPAACANGSSVRAGQEPPFRSFPGLPLDTAWRSFWELLLKLYSQIFNFRFYPYSWIHQCCIWHASYSACSPPSRWFTIPQCKGHSKNSNSSIGLSKWSYL
jgi:hypothetical protein